MFFLKQFVNSSFCLECKGCCRFSQEIWQPQLLELDKQRSGIKTIPVKIEGDNIVCSFLKEDSHLCQIYNQRLFECELYPFLLSRREQTLDLVTHLACSFIMEMQGKPEYENYTRYLIDTLSSAEIVRMLKKEIKMFRLYPQDEVSVIKEDILKLLSS